MRMRFFSTPGLAAVFAAAPAVASETAEHGEGMGFPQLDPSSYASQVFWLFVAFVLLYALMSKLALPRVAVVVDARAAEQEGNLNNAQQSQEEAQKIRAAYESSLARAQETAQEALRAAEQEIAEKAAAENADFADRARKRVVGAEQAIDKARREALNALADISADIAAEMTQKIADINVAKADAKKTVTTLMQKEHA